ncbi:30S ribosomal protein S7 [Candidatus Woesearchaeota archaeon]|nr:30S ribosomal protein S7 [Candidatus Woesearchaeota archaeon]
MKLFNRWETNFEVNDTGLKSYININPLMIPRTGGRNVGTQFWKSKTHIVERLINKLMIPGHRGKKHRISSGHNTGKSVTTYNIVLKTFEIIEQKLKKNPVEVFVRAVENAAPREEITTIEYGGARYSQAVECAPQRRVDLALRNIVQGAYSKTFKNKKRMWECLADEIILVYNMDNKSNAIARKLELERQADASR